MTVLVSFLKHHLWRCLTFYVIVKVWVIFRCYAYSSSDYFLSSVAISDWSIFCCWNLILHQKNDENTNFLIKNKRKSHILYSELTPNDPWCNMLQALEMQRKYNEMKMWVEHTVIVLIIEAQFFSCLSLNDKTFNSQQMQRRIQDSVKYLRWSFLRI